MKKLTLDVDTLKVESFHPSSAVGMCGTVIGADGGRTLTPFCITFTCGDSHIRPCLEAY